jgi:DNA end-binding protein Ku
MRAIWSGTIGFGLVSIPVSLYSALEASEHVSFRQLHRKDRSPIRYKKFCSKEDVEVPNSEIVRAYQTSKGKWTIVEDEDVEAVREKTGKGSRTIDVLQFVPLNALNPLSFDHPYYVAPEKGGEKAYALLRDALLDTRRVGIVRFFYRTRPVLGSLIPGPKVLALETLRTADELRDAAELKIPKASVRPNEVKLARSLVEQMAEDAWDPTAHPDEYEKALRTLLASRRAVAVEEERAAEEGEGAKGVDLMEAHRRSRRATRGRNGRASGRRRGARKRRAA